jgi:hypothetical protein
MSVADLEGKFGLSEGKSAKHLLPKDTQPSWITKIVTNRATTELLDKPCLARALYLLS